jgi:hypothetical protein
VKSFYMRRRNRSGNPLILIAGAVVMALLAAAGIFAGYHTAGRGENSPESSIVE